VQTGSDALGLPPPLWVRLLLLVILPLISVALYLEGQSFDSGLLELEAGKGATGSLAPETLAGLAAIGAIRRYDVDNLYEYVDGHAEYYISSGFQGLTVAEYGPAGAPQPSLVANLYDLGKPLQAFGVLMNELGADAEPVEVGGMGFQAGQGVSFILGNLYVQLTGFESQEAPIAAAKELEAALRRRVGETQELNISFPRLGEPLSTHFIKEDYRGFGVFSNVLERTFRRGEQEITAFLVTASGDAIAATFSKLQQFLDGEGIPVERREFDKAALYLVKDRYEGDWFLILEEGRLLGVFAPPDEELVRAALSQDGSN